MPVKIIGPEQKQHGIAEQIEQLEKEINELEGVQSVSLSSIRNDRENKIDLYAAVICDEPKEKIKINTEEVSEAITENDEPFDEKIQAAIESGQLEESDNVPAPVNMEVVNETKSESDFTPAPEPVKKSTKTSNKKPGKTAKKKNKKK